MPTPTATPIITESGDNIITETGVLDIITEGSVPPGPAITNFVFIHSPIPTCSTAGKL